MAPKKKPLVPGQVAWMNHVLGDGTNTARKPAAVKPPTPQKKAGQTRARAAARSRAAAIPDYTPEMQSGGGRGGLPTPPKKVNLPVPVGKNLPVPYKPPGLPASTRPPAPPRGGGGFGRALRGLGVVGTTLAVADGIKQIGIATGISKPQNVVVGGAEMQAVKKYGAKAVSDYKSGQRNALPTPTRSPSSRPVTPGSSNAKMGPPAPKLSRMSDYGAAPTMKTGKFLRKAYYTNRLYAMGTSVYGDQGAVFRDKKTKDAAYEAFKKTHKWAREAKTPQQKRNLHNAVMYLANTQHPAYWKK